MKTKVFLREENTFKDIEITDSTKPKISDEIINKWQNIINLITNIIEVSAGLIMKITPETMVVVLKSQNEDNPYEVGGSYSLGHGLYCETVVGENKELYIKNALNMEAWKDNPNSDLDMISYFGLPVKWPDGKIFGTICILDDKSMDLDEKSKKLLKEFKNIIEDDLILLGNQQDLKVKSKAIKNTIAGTIFLNMQGEIFYANDSFLKMSGHKKPEEIYDTSLTLFDLIPETEFDKIKKAIEITLEKGKWQGESKIIKVSEEEIDIKISASLVTDDNKQPVCMMASFEDITERKKEEKEIKEQKDFLSTILDVQSGLVVLLDSEGQIVRFNNACEKLTGYTEDEVKGKKVWDLFVKSEEKEGVKNVFKKLKSKDYPNKYENYWLTKTGEKKLISWSNNIIIDNDNKIKYIVGTGIDITKRENQELKIKDQKNKLNWIIEGTDAGTWEWNVQTGKTFFNDKWAEILGYKLEELEPTSIETWKRYTHPEDFKRAEKELEKHLKREIEQYDVEIRMKHKDGHWVWINDRGRVVSWTKDNKPLKMFGMHLDITERKNLENKFKEKNNQLNSIFTSIQDGITLLNPDLTISYTNPTMKKWFKNQTNFKEKKCFHAFYDKKNKCDDCPVQRSLKSGEMESSIKELPDEFEIDYIEIFSYPIYDQEKNKITGFVEFVQDISENVKQQKELKMTKFSINKANLMIMRVTPEGIIEYVNNTTLKKLNYNRKEMIGLEVEKIIEKKNYIQREKFWNKVKNQKSIVYEKKLITKDGKIFPVEVTNQFFCYNDKEYEFAFIKDISERKKHEKEIKYLLYRDSLTELYNRRFFMEELERLDTKRQLPISIIMADINGLKIINDSLGHKKGDQLLKKSANILKESIRQEDILARQGGDEFAILLPKTEKRKAEKLIARIKEKSSQTNDDELTVTIALGAAAKTDQDQNINDILRTADNNMYQNKLSESIIAKNRIIQSLLNNLEIKSYETREHIERMKRLAVDFGKELDFSNSELNRLSMLAKLHDIGKTTIDAKILNKPGRLNDAEWEIIKEHSEKGYQIASSSQKFATVADEIFTHHERWDGSGYPKGIKREDIPYLARIISIIDAYDVMTNDRPYSKAISKKDALAELKRCSGNHFDPELAETFIKMMES